MKFRIAGFCIALLLLLTGSAFAQWQLAYEQELAYDFNAVHFPTATNGCIVGSGGVIYTTTDAGATWVQQASPTTNSLNDVFFPDALNGYAVGAGGTIIYTNDGGTTWFVHAQSGAITTNTLYGIWFVGSNGWMCGGTTSSAEVYSTSDGGVTWANNVVTNPSADTGNDISFSSATNGYVALDGQGIMYTTDGGINWNLSTINLGPYPYTRSDIEAIRMIDATRAVATGWGSPVGPQPTIILYSSDSGATFSNPDTLYPWKTYAYGYGIARCDNGEVLIVGGSGGSAAPNLHSMNNGATWSRYPTFYGDDLNDAWALPGTATVVAVGDCGLIARSLDRGLTWSYNYDPGSAYQGVGDLASRGAETVYGCLTGSALLKFDVPSGTHKYIMASPENWGPYNMMDIDYVVNPGPPIPGPWGPWNNDAIYISGSNLYLIKSRDYGRTWTELAHSVSNYEAMNGMYWFHPDTGFVVGNTQRVGLNRRQETIWKTVDGGQNLTVVLSGTVPVGTTNMQWNDVDFSRFNRNYGIVVGDDNYIFYTTDGGVNWNTATENIATSTIDVEDVVFVDDSTAFAVGDSGTLIKSTDAGASWLVQTVPWGTVNLIDIEASTPNRLWVSGADQLLYYSTDGGATWTNASITALPATSDVMAVYYQGSAGILWAGCHYARVFYRDDIVAGTETPKSLPFILNQNFPNPFNPSTTIKFSLAYDDHVTLNVYNVAGKLVATVMDRDLKAGDYNVAFRADGLATGVYFYRLSTSRGEETRKMVLLR